MRWVLAAAIIAFAPAAHADTIRPGLTGNDSGGIIQWQRLGIRVAAEPKRRKLSMYKPLRRSFEMLPQQVPAVRKPVMTRRSGCRGHRRGIVEASVFR